MSKTLNLSSLEAKTLTLILTRKFNEWNEYGDNFRSSREVSCTVLKDILTKLGQKVEDVRK